MESFLKGLGDGSLGLTTEEKELGQEQERIFEDAWDKILGDIEPSSPTSTSTTPADARKNAQRTPEGSFQDRVRQTMEKMKEGQTSLKVCHPTIEAL